MAKKSADRNGIVWSTAPDFQFDEDAAEKETLLPGHQKLRLRLETKGRGGKPTTVIAGFVGKDNDFQTLAKSLKNLCGSGGSAKEGLILIQGDQRTKILDWLKGAGYKDSK